MDQLPIITSKPASPASGTIPASAPAGADEAAGRQRREVLARRIRLLVGATIAYNVVEAIVAITAGHRADSTALIGFGLDSVIEVSSAAAVAWQFSAREHARREAREHLALRIIAVSFFALAAYVSVESVRALLSGGHAQESSVGIALAALSLLIMPFLSAAQRRAGRELGSATAVADSKQTLLCTYLSAILLIGLLLNAVVGWSWADPIAGLAIAVIAVREGRQAWRGEGCCAPAGGRFSAASPDEAASANACSCGDDCCR
ncbi:cation transporter [Kineosporia rhizophila]|uniref:cation diffusion facilitator family transporter n=1 Tax=Kineosporia rhizophila TaxID=84633 RepID=UPI001E5205C5|nr:cation transporter [Kineosporia rhizophila]MCE0536082.1 cation transporter [Kineosporia rhizophila]